MWCVARDIGYSVPPAKSKPSAADARLIATCENSQDCILPEHLREAPAAEPREPKRLSDARVEQLRKQYARGLSLTKLAARFGISLSAASRIVNRSRRA